ncbi:MAG TPA: hypothetical protein VM943_03220, partial [Pyrinomonadaceae bacterium]|nr:hypothetical protein [Pyrinomonadaceae bacterium]
MASLGFVRDSKYCKGEIRTSSGFNARAQTSGDVCVIPSGQPFTATIEGEAEYLAVYLDPYLVLRAAAEDAPATAGGGVEVIEKSSLHDPLVIGIGQALLA